MIKIKRINPTAKLPTRGSEDAAGFDIYLPHDVGLHAYFSEHVMLGFATELPKGYCALLIPRSGVGSKKGLGLRNTIGLIDSDYRGEWQARLVIDGEQDFIHLKEGERILQAVIVKHENLKLVEVDQLDDTPRGEGGFGSTGL